MAWLRALSCACLLSGALGAGRALDLSDSVSVVQGRVHAHQHAAVEAPVEAGTCLAAIGEEKEERLEPALASKAQLVVVREASEDVRWLDAIPEIPAVVYSHSGLAEQLPQPRANLRVETQPNTGVQAESLLRHIVNNYDNLPDLTVFLNGWPFYACAGTFELVRRGLRNGHNLVDSDMVNNGALPGLVPLAGSFDQFSIKQGMLGHWRFMNVAERALQNMNAQEATDAATPAPSTLGAGRGRRAAPALGAQVACPVAQPLHGHTSTSSTCLAAAAAREASPQARYAVQPVAWQALSRTCQASQQRLQEVPAPAPAPQPSPRLCFRRPLETTAPPRKSPRDGYPASAASAASSSSCRPKTQAVPKLLFRDVTNVAAEATASPPASARDSARSAGDMPVSPPPAAPRSTLQGAVGMSYKPDTMTLSTSCTANGALPDAGGSSAFVAASPQPAYAVVPSPRPSPVLTCRTLASSRPVLPSPQAPSYQPTGTTSSVVRLLSAPASGQQPALDATTLSISSAGSGPLLDGSAAPPPQPPACAAVPSPRPSPVLSCREVALSPLPSARESLGGSAAAAAAASPRPSPALGCRELAAGAACSAGAISPWASPVVTCREVRAPARSREGPAAAAEGPRSSANVEASLECTASVHRFASVPDKWIPSEMPTITMSPPSTNTLSGSRQGCSISMMAPSPVQSTTWLATWTQGNSVSSTSAPRATATKSLSPVRKAQASPRPSFRKLGARAQAEGPGKERRPSPVRSTTPGPRPRLRPAAPGAGKAAAVEPRPPLPPPPRPPGSPLAPAARTAAPRAAAAGGRPGPAASPPRRGPDSLQGSRGSAEDSLQGSLGQLFSPQPVLRLADSAGCLVAVQERAPPFVRDEPPLTDRSGAESSARRRWRDDQQLLCSSRQWRTTDNLLSEACVGLQSKLELLRDAERSKCNDEFTI